jgi:hypothetical protein
MAVRREVRRAQGRDVLVVEGAQTQDPGPRQKRGVVMVARSARAGAIVVAIAPPLGAQRVEEVAQLPFAPTQGMPVRY